MSKEIFKENTTLVVGLGEIGGPLFGIIKEKCNTIGVDIDPIEYTNKVDIMHVCYPFEIKDFIETTVNYVRKYNPELTIINSTVTPGTTRAIFKKINKPIVHSPIRGKHIKMKEDLQYYTKFIGGINGEWSEKASEHFQAIGFKTKICSSPETTELAKLTGTTYFGILIAWAQEVERYCIKLDLNYDEVVSFYEEIKFFPPVKYTPGFIGGHCVIPNIKLLKQIFDSDILDDILKSNDKKVRK